MRWQMIVPLGVMVLQAGCNGMPAAQSLAVDGGPARFVSGGGNEIILGVDSLKIGNDSHRLIDCGDAERVCLPGGDFLFEAPRSCRPYNDAQLPWNSRLKVRAVEPHGGGWFLSADPPTKFVFQYSPSRGITGIYFSESGFPAGNGAAIDVNAQRLAPFRYELVSGSAPHPCE